MSRRIWLLSSGYIKDCMFVCRCALLETRKPIRKISWAACRMFIGQRLRELRETRDLTQDDIARRSGFPRPYISRIENGHAIPSIETLERLAGALSMKLFQVLYEDEEPIEPVKSSSKSRKMRRNSGPTARELHRLRRILAQMNDNERKLLLSMAGHMASWSRKR